MQRSDPHAPTLKQLRLAARIGVVMPPGTTRSQLSELIAERLGEMRQPAAVRFIAWVASLFGVK